MVNTSGCVSGERLTETTALEYLILLKSLSGRCMGVAALCRPLAYRIQIMTYCLACRFLLLLIASDLK